MAENNADPHMQRGRERERHSQPNSQRIRGKEVRREAGMCVCVSMTAVAVSMFGKLFHSFSPSSPPLLALRLTGNQDLSPPCLLIEREWERERETIHTLAPSDSTRCALTDLEDREREISEAGGKGREGMQERQHQQSRRK